MHLREKERGLDHVKRASYYKAQIWDDFRAVRGVFTAINRFEYILKGSYHLSHAENDKTCRYQESGQDC